MISISGYAETDDAIVNLELKLQNIIKDKFPKADFATKPNFLQISENVMTYMIHTVDKTGSISEKAHEENGPKHNGFLLRIQVVEGIYQGAADLPQTLKGPYWDSEVFIVNLMKRKAYLHVKFSFGKQISKEFVEKIIEIIKKGSLSKTVGSIVH